MMMDSKSTTASRLNKAHGLTKGRAAPCINNKRLSSINLKFNLKNPGFCCILIFLYKSLKPYFIFLE